MTVPSLDPIQVTTEVTPPDVKQLTTNSVDGTGVFDLLMKAVKIHLTEEYEMNRITGEQYSTVYLGALGAVLQNSISFLANHQQEKLIGAQIAHVRQQTVTELANTDNDIPLGLGFNGSPVVEGLVASKLAIDLLQKDLVAAQILSATADKDLMGQKIITELAQTDIGITQAAAAGYGYNDGDTVSGALEGANMTSLANAMLAEQKVATELAQTSSIKPAGLGESASTSFSGMVQAQVDLVTTQKSKAAQEQILLAQKTMTELAQTSETLPSGTSALNTGVTVTGSVSYQQKLYTAQTDGFARDAEQKVAKMLLDTWNVNATLGNVTANTANHLDDPSIGSVVAKAIAGVL